MVTFRTRDLKVTKRYDEGESPPAPLLPITLYTPTRRKKISLEARINTGFSGSVARHFLNERETNKSFRRLVCQR